MGLFVYKHSFYNKNIMIPVHCSIQDHLCFEQNI